MMTLPLSASLSLSLSASLSLTASLMSAALVCAAFVSGAALWSFAEYALHNWVGHLGKGKNAFSREHLAHHAKVHYFSPTYRKVIAALITLTLLSPLAIWALSPLLGFTFSLGFVFGYSAYEVLHRRLHTHAPLNGYGRWARKHHFYHHFASPQSNHGVTSPLWDILFKTHTPITAPIRVPRKQAMRWLLDPTSGDLLPTYERDYVLVGRPPKPTAPSA
jgi:hypothetical protein